MLFLSVDPKINTLARRIQLEIENITVVNNFSTRSLSSSLSLICLMTYLWISQDEKLSDADKSLRDGKFQVELVINIQLIEKNWEHLQKVSLAQSNQQTYILQNSEILSVCSGNNLLLSRAVIFCYFSCNLDRKNQQF